MRTQVVFETSVIGEAAGSRSCMSERTLRVTATVEDLPGMGGEAAVTIDKVEERLFGRDWVESLDWEEIEWRLEEEATAEAEKHLKRGA